MRLSHAAVLLGWTLASVPASVLAGSLMARRQAPALAPARPIAALPTIAEPAAA